MTDAEIKARFPRTRINSLPVRVRDAMLETLRSDEPIAVGNWIVTRGDVECGCLLTDGLKQKQFDLFLQLKSLLNGHRGRDIQSILTDFYGCEYHGRDLFVAANQFDNWAARCGLISQRKDLQGKTPNGLLGNRGRKLMIQILEGMMPEPVVEGDPYP